jgi:hypothetical protein
MSPKQQAFPAPVTPDYRSPFRFVGGQIERVVVDVSGERYVDHEAQVGAWLIGDRGWTTLHTAITMPPRARYEPVGRIAAGFPPERHS